MSLPKSSAIFFFFIGNKKRGTYTCTMGLPEELYLALLEVCLCARREKVPQLDSLIGVAERSLELWRRDERTMAHFARGVLSGPTNLRETTGQLPEPVASACWRLIRLLEYLASSDDGLSSDSKAV